MIIVVGGGDAAALPDDGGDEEGAAAAAPAVDDDAEGLGEPDGPLELEGALEQVIDDELQKQEEAEVSSGTTLPPHPPHPPQTPWSRRNRCTHPGSPWEYFGRGEAWIGTRQVSSSSIRGCPEGLGWSEWVGG